MADNIKTFDVFEPKKAITDPLNLGANRDYPAHVFKWGGTAVDPATEEPYAKPNRFREVKNEDEKRAALEDGWAASPVLHEPKAPKKGAVAAA